MTETLSRRDRLRQGLEQDIKDVAMGHLAVEGGAVSMRAVARDVGISPQGLYRYYDSRDALLTALIADAYTQLATALERARDDARTARGTSQDPAGLRAELTSAGLAYRTWALEHPERFRLIYGGPIPGYSAPDDGATAAAAARLAAVFLDPLTEAHRAHRLRVRDVTPELATALARWSTREAPATPPEAVHAMLTAWGRLHGYVVLESFGHLGALGPGTEDLYREQLDAVLDELGPAALG